MTQYIVRRLGYSLVSLFLLSLTIFLFVRVARGMTQKSGAPVPGASGPDRPDGAA